MSQVLEISAPNENFKLWKNFNFSNADISLWVFKKSSTLKKYNLYLVNTDDAIEILFKESVIAHIQSISEHKNYGVLAQNNESSCLHQGLEVSENIIALLQAVDDTQNSKTFAKIKDLKNSIGYLVKFHNPINNQNLYAVRKTSPQWKTIKRKNVINTFFRDGELSVEKDENFLFDNYFDFYIVNESIFIANKKNYESTASDKTVYKKAFDDLIVDNNFTAIFSDINLLKQHIGSNAIQLRRMTVIQQKAIYLNPNFISNLQRVNHNRSWGIDFDCNNKISISEKNIKTILQVLLDHRLYSEITEVTYDVPDAEVI